MIKGDTEFAHIVAAERAIDEHKRKFGDGNKHHPFIYTIKYRSRPYQIEVTNKKKHHVAYVIARHRKLENVHYGEVA